MPTEQDLFCDICLSYVHPYLDHCPACGNARESHLPEALWDSQSEKRLLTLEEIKDYWQRTGKGELFPWAKDLSLEELNEQYGPATARSGMHQVTLDFLANHPQDEVGSFIRTLKPRYLGGISAHPYQTDIGWDANPHTGILRFSQGRSGAQMLALHASQILAVTAFERESALLNQWYGVGFGNVITFVSPSFHGGGATITYSFQGHIGQISLGNRTGLFVRKGEPGWWGAFAAIVGAWASRFASLRELEIGGESYARELGFPVSEYVS